jgi:DNA invertase Pin-like site-specific DNA recombinase
MPEYIAYYRVSTERQGASGLGLDAQRHAVTQFIGAGQLVGAFVEVESGRRHTNRPQLAAALAECRKRRATLVIAKLDRLARNVHFISGLMESGVEFVAVDMPQASRLTIHILAAVAEHEREAISQRTKVALAQAKARGTALGNPRLHEARKAAAKATRTQPPAEVIQIMIDRRRQGETLRTIADRLNRLDIRTPNGNRWHPETVKRELLDKERTA